ncbi:hypothetical protein HMPREF0083_01793 [Aneurinibacillus aneurinilyticus ATCC 12856]|uniref:Uncharacterized protein n=1 Tax=Aneurinibacillus aneurinilyticus ATCC 12856 TaxID=649747 RepID=U1WNJ9_ANEAE|nr:hypothetical protein HMPREF0083_01793 [Aneurinibacillus aneurinilyticus ATCC 12856]
MKGYFLFGNSGIRYSPFYFKDTQRIVRMELSYERYKVRRRR